ncbi:unnamed protein product [Cylicocyclus nassatus]|uniref:Uncharacterized protein n=1 Tax=Cylicocyclus nassatus TaxID=53992 RepID=A0AA36DKB9_CYLNA|nr:unnamed protein product [Cylicocyclus nassatus]
MWATVIVFSAIVTLVNAAAWNVRAHVGQSVALNIGPGVVTWKRQRPGYPAEYIEYCEPEDKRAICGQFVTAGTMYGKPIIVLLVLFACASAGCLNGLMDMLSSCICGGNDEKNTCPKLMDRNVLVKVGLVDFNLGL